MHGKTGKPRTIVDIEKAAKLTVRDDRSSSPRFVRWKPLPADLKGPQTRDGAASSPETVLTHPLLHSRFHRTSARTRSVACLRCFHRKPSDNGSTRRRSGRCCGCVASSATRRRGLPKRSLCARASPDQAPKGGTTDYRLSRASPHG